MSLLGGQICIKGKCFFYMVLNTTAYGKTCQPLNPKVHFVGLHGIVFQLSISACMYQTQKSDNSVAQSSSYNNMHNSQ